MSEEAEETYVSGLQLAKVLGIHERMVRKHRDAGLFKPATRGPNAGKYPLNASKAAFASGRDPDSVLKGIAGAEALARGETGDKMDSLAGNPLMRARAAQAVLGAQRQQLELAKRKGELIARADVEAAIRTAQTVVVERLEGLPGQLAARVMQAPSVPAAEAIIREAIRSVREELARMGEQVETAGG